MWPPLFFARLFFPLVKAMASGIIALTGPQFSSLQVGLDLSLSDG